MYVYNSNSIAITKLLLIKSTTWILLKEKSHIHIYHRWISNIRIKHKNNNCITSSSNKRTKKIITTERDNNNSNKRESSSSTKVVVEFTKMDNNKLCLIKHTCEYIYTTYKFATMVAQIYI